MSRQYLGFYSGKLWQVGEAFIMADVNKGSQIKKKWKFVVTATLQCTMVFVVIAVSTGSTLHVKE